MIDESWLGSVFAEEPEAPLAITPINQNTPIRVIKSSGTTGRHKRMLLTRRLHDFRIDQAQYRAGFRRSSRLLAVMAISVQSYYVRAHCVSSHGWCGDF